MARHAGWAVLGAVLLWCGALGAQTPEAGEAATHEEQSAEPPVSPELQRARALYSEGVEHVKHEEWAEGLAAFDASAKLRPHATTTFNVAVCQRALGQYTRAQSSLRLALRQGEAEPDQLAASLKSEAQAMLSQIEGALANVDVTLDPPEAQIAVDGRPLRFSSSKGKLVALAGVEEPGPGRRPPGAKFRLILNPGAHVFTLSRKGYSDAIVNRSYGPGSRSRLPLEIAKLPATLRISSTVDGAIVRVAGVDLGPVPVEVLRPAGSYHVVVSKQGYQPYESQLSVRAGELSSLRANLTLETHPITKKWWFWAGAATVVVGGALATYALTRPDPAPPPYDGGNTDWVVRPNRWAF